MSQVYPICKQLCQCHMSVALLRVTYLHINIAHQYSGPEKVQEYGKQLILDILLNESYFVFHAVCFGNELI